MNLMRKMLFVRHMLVYAVLFPGMLVFALSTHAAPAVDKLLVEAERALKVQDYSRAMDFAERAQRIAPSDARPWWLLAEIQAQRGNHKQATLLRQRARLIDPDPDARRDRPEQPAITRSDDAADRRVETSHRVKPARSTKQLSVRNDPRSSQTRHASRNASKRPELKQRDSRLILRTPVLYPIDKTYTVITRSNLRAGPATSYAVIGKLATSQRVHVAGRVEGADWVMVTRDGMGVGFVYFPLLRDPQTRPASLRTGRVRVSDQGLKIERDDARNVRPVSRNESVKRRECVDTQQTMIKPDGEIEHVPQRYCRDRRGHWKAVR